jgi:F-type H+-transporting ATPase subunit b
MRHIRFLLAVLAIGLVGSVVAATPAAAQDLDADEECLVETYREQFGEDATADEIAALPDEELSELLAECYEAPNPLIPEPYEIFWGVFGLVVVLAGMWKFALPAMRTTLDARADRIRTDLESAEAQRTEASTILTEYQNQLADAKNESARIIEEARQTADDMRRQLAVRAEEDIATMRSQAATDIESAKAQAIADLRGEVASLAIGAAEQVIGRNLDQETNVALVEAYINQVGADGLGADR